jgi:hypothetical protein
VDELKALLAQRSRASTREMQRASWGESAMGIKPCGLSTRPAIEVSARERPPNDTFVTLRHPFKSAYLMVVQIPIRRLRKPYEVACP